MDETGLLSSFREHMRKADEFLRMAENELEEGRASNVAPLTCLAHAHTELAKLKDVLLNGRR